MRLINLVAVYQDIAIAEHVRTRLIIHGAPPASIRLTADPQARNRSGTAFDNPDAQNNSRPSHSGPSHTGDAFLDWLFSGDQIPDLDRAWYRRHLGARTAVSVTVDEDQAEHYRAVLESADPVEIGIEPSSWDAGDVAGRKAASNPSTGGATRVRTYGHVGERSRGGRDREAPGGDSPSADEPTGSDEPEEPPRTDPGIKS